MHCVAGDGIGIVVGAVIAALVALPIAGEVALEYVLGFLFGWTIFQAFAMRDMAGGSYKHSLETTFIPELLSMNCLMGGMVPVMVLAWQGVPEAHDPSHGLFWFRMSLALIVGVAVAYPMNWWLVQRHLKHGMVTIPEPERVKKMSSSMVMHPVSRETIAMATVVSFVVLGAGFLIAYLGS